jgi:3-oxoadipate enol-lactonase
VADIINMQITVSDGTALEVIDVAPTAASPLVLVHGHGGAKEDFGDHLAALSERRRVITLDLRGHGDSGKPESAGAYSLDRMADDLADLADALGLERFDLLGHSMGGMVARRFVLRYPERIHRLIFMDTCAGPLPGFEPEIIEAGAQIALEQGMVELKRILDEVAPLQSASGERLRAARPGYQEFSDWKFARLSGVMWATMLRELMSQPDQLVELANVTCETLVIAGAEDEKFLPTSEDIARTMPNARFVVIPDAAHSPQFENPGAWLDVVTEFLS